MNKSESVLKLEVVQRGITWLRARCIPLTWMWCSGILLGTMIAGCSTVTSVAPVAVEVAACQLASSKPYSAPFLKLAGEVFLEFSGGEAPTPTALESALEKIPGTQLTPTESRAVWAVFVLAYKSIYSPNMSETKQEELRDALQRIGVALLSGSDCAVGSRKMTGQVLKEDVSSVARSAASVIK